MADISFIDFLKKQASVYQKFSEAEPEIEKNGLKKHKLAGVGANVIYFIHPSDISQKVEDISQSLAKVVPIVIYSAPNVHTTITDYDLRAGFEPNNDVLGKLSLGVRNVLSILRVPEIDYVRLLANGDTVILGGIPNKDFVTDSERILASIAGQGLELRLPWGAHITCARINDVVTDKEKVAHFMSMVNSYRDRLYSRPTHIGVGYGMFDATGSDFQLHKFDEHKLN